MSKELHIALQNAIGDLGTDVLKSPHLVNILQDYGAFGVHDKHSLIIKQWLADLVRAGVVEEIISWKKLSDKEIRSKGLSLLNRYNDAVYLRHFIDSLLKALSIPTLISSEFSSNQIINNPNTANNPIPNLTVIKLINKTTYNNHSDEYKRFSTKNVIFAVMSLIITIIPISYAILLIIDGAWDVIENVIISNNIISFRHICFVVGVIGPFTNPDFWK